MRTYPKLILTVLLLASASINVWSQSSKKALYRIKDTATGDYGYVNAKGDTIIPIGKYDMCFTEQFYKFAIVIAKGKGLVGIDQNENILFNVYIVDNGPDYPCNGLFRIVQNGKIGFANLKGKLLSLHNLIAPILSKTEKHKLEKDARQGQTENITIGQAASGILLTKKAML
jgi:hypothetical protein